MQTPLSSHPARDLSAARQRRPTAQNCARATTPAEAEDLVSTAVHDLRAPLRKASAFAAELKRHLADRLDETGRDLMDRMLHGVEEMQGLVDGLMQLSRARTGALQPVPVDLAALAEQVVAEF